MRNAKGLRQAAIRKAQQAKQERDAKRLRRERQVEAALAEFFEHTALAEAIQTATEAKITALAAAAVTAVSRERVNAAVAVRAMLELGETRTAVAELTGLTLPAVRDLLSAADPSAAAGMVAPQVPDGVPRQHRAPDEAATAVGYDPPRELYDPPSELEAEVPCDASAYAAAYPSPAVARWPDPPDWARPDPLDWTRPERVGDSWTT
ncbi:MAG: hypothetical protein QOI26_690 [Pseudonocardiales bacterium]|jgi:hypothetical protein|nr:hypothetical protein [Pseudonocardiales bacterium]